MTTNTGNTLPDGYHVIEVKKNSIIIGMYDFLLMFKDAVPFITYNGNRYKRGILYAIPERLIGHCCSCREYIKVDI